MVFEVTQPVEHVHKVTVGDPPWVCQTCGASVLLFTKTFRADPSRTFYVGLIMGSALGALIAMLVLSL